MQPQLTAETVHNVQKKIIHPSQYVVLAVAGLNLICGDYADATKSVFFSLVLEKGFQLTYRLLNNAQLAATMNLYMPRHYSIPTKFGLTLFNGLATTLKTVGTAIQSGVAAIEEQYNTPNA